MNQKRVAAILIMFSLVLPAFSQGTCGTVVSEKAKAFRQSILRLRQANADSLTTGFLMVPILPHIVRRSDGTGGLNEITLSQAISTLNQYYNGTGINFFYDSINTITSDRYFDFDASLEDAIGNTNDMDGVVNIYFSNSLSSGETPLCGYTYLPPSVDRIFIANACLSGATLEHEVGHYLGLYHTHGTTNFGTTNELVDGTNCETAGDFICDTPADPNLSGKVASGCSYIGDDVDANGDPFRPQVRNIMSYAPGVCRDIFSPEQYQLMRNTFEVGRSYLNFEVDTLSVDIEISTGGGCTSRELQFNAKSSRAFQFNWEFSGANRTTAQTSNPVVIYDTPGEYPVKLTVQSGPLTASTETTVQILDKVEDGIKEQAKYDFNQGLPEGVRIFGEVFKVEDDSENVMGGQSLQLETNRSTAGIVLEKLNYYGVQNYTLTFAVKPSPADNSCDWLLVKAINRCDASETVLANPGCEDLSALADIGNGWKQLMLEVPNTGGSDLMNIEISSYSEEANVLLLDQIMLQADYDLIPPSDFEVQDEGGVFRLSWVDNSVNELTFRIEGARGQETYETILEVEKNKNRAVITDDLSGYAQLQVVAVGLPGFEATSNVISRNVLGMNEQSTLIYPNPTREFLNLPQQEKQGFRILSTDGKLRDTGVTENGKIDVRSLPAGLYFLVLEGAWTKFIKQ